MEHDLYLFELLDRYQKDRSAPHFQNPVMAADSKKETTPTSTLYFSHKGRH